MIGIRASRAARQHVVIGALMILLAGSGGCGDSTEPGSCGDAPEIAITQGLSPRFSWAPACSVAGLSVSRDDGTQQSWEITAAGNTIESGVDYGIVPPSATQSATAVELQPGVAYAVVIRVFLVGAATPSVLTQKVFQR
jgi:hypothetical protein